MRLNERGIPILLMSLFLTGVGGGIVLAADDPVERLLELRLHTEQAIAQMRAEGDRDLADEMERQLPGALAEVADRVSAAIPELPMMDPRTPEAALAQAARNDGAPLLKDQLQHDPVADRLTRLEHFDGTRGNGVYDELPATLTYEEKVLARYEHQVAMTETQLAHFEAKFESRWEALPLKFADQPEKLNDARGKLIEQVVGQREKAEEKLAKIEEKKEDQLAKAQDKLQKAEDPSPAPAPAPNDKNDKDKAK